MQAETTTETPSAPHRPAAVEWIRATRPPEWLKNVVVFVAPGAAGVLDTGSGALRSFEAFLVFCAAASAAYFVNDVVDAPADRIHPVKRLRPIASGRVSVPVALASAGALCALAFMGAWLIAGWRLLVVMGIYAASTVAYSVWLKHIPVIEMTVIASGFVLRGIAGGVATHQQLSSWFLVVTSLGALFLVVGKRMGERERLGDEAALYRSALAEYSTQFLRSALTLAAAGSVTTYCLWAFDRAGLARRGDHLVWIELSVAPVIAAVLWVLRILEAGGGGSPTKLAWNDRTLQVLGLLWALMVGIGVYA